jgi:hypothetical protein
MKEKEADVYADTVWLGTKRNMLEKLNKTERMIFFTLVMGFLHSLNVRNKQQQTYRHFNTGSIFCKYGKAFIGKSDRKSCFNYKF